MYLGKYSMADMETTKYANFARKKGSKDKGQRKSRKITGPTTKALVDDGTGRQKLNAKGLARGKQEYNKALNKGALSNAFGNIKRAVKDDFRNAKQILGAKGQYGKSTRGVAAEIGSRSSAGTEMQNRIMNSITGGGKQVRQVYGRGRGTKSISGLRKVGEVIRRTGVGKAGAGLALVGAAGAGYAGYKALKNRKKK